MNSANKSKLILLLFIKTFLTKLIHLKNTDAKQIFLSVQNILPIHIENIYINIDRYINKGNNITFYFQIPMTIQFQCVFPSKFIGNIH